MKDIKLIDIIQRGSIEISPYEILINLVIALLLSLLIYLIYKITYSGAVYSKSFGATLVMVTIVTTMVIMVIGTNLAMSLGMVGALSIIRFRSALKDPKDSGYLFWGIASGLACGAGVYIIAIIGFLIIAFIMIIFSIDIFNSNNYLLIIQGKKIDFDDIDKLIKQLCKSKKLRMKNFNEGNCEIIYEVKLDNKKEELIIEELKSINDISIVNIVSYKGDTV